MLTVDFELLEAKAGQKILDAGCGAGRHSYEAHRKKMQVFALDYCQEEVKKVMYGLADAEKRISSNSHPWLVLQGDVHHLPFPDDFFDRIICSEVIEHIYEDVRVLKELARILKPRGRIAITTPTYFTEYAYDKLSPLYFSNPGGHIRKFLPGELAEKIRLCGLKIYAVRFAHGLHSPYWLLRCIFGLENENHPVSRAYRWILVKSFYSPAMKKVEKVLNYICPKSIIFYAWKPEVKEL